METKIVIKTLFIWVLFSSLTQAQEHDESIYIEAKISDIIVLNENYCSKTIFKDKIVFSLGLETLGEVNKFYFKKGDSKRKIGKKEYKSLNLSSISELNEILIKRKKLKHPNLVFKEIYIVENKPDSIVIYKVYWKKVFFIE